MRHATRAASDLQYDMEEIPGPRSLSVDLIRVPALQLKQALRELKVISA
jgi:hypothetical protein